MAKLKSLLMSTKNRDYDPMSEDGYDSKIPLHTEEAFQHGIHFDAKFVGSMEVAKPASRAEIVASMRRIRYDFKAKSVKKRKVNISISVEGIKVSLWKKTKKDKFFDENRIVILQHPIYRVFYVSHDSQDLKIFSFIARDSVNNCFRCNVFKANKKNDAMRIVRTIGQAFEVCHKLALQKQNPSPTNKPIEDEPKKTSTNEISTVEKPESYLPSVQISSTTNEMKPIQIFQSHSSSEFTLKHQMQFMQEQLQQMQHESEVAFNQIKLIKDQLNIEIAARIDAQTKNAELLQRNRELLTHIQQLLMYTNKLELKLTNSNGNFDAMKTLPTRPTDLLLPSLYLTSAATTTTTTSNQLGLSSDSPDSGKGKEISSESISDPFFATMNDVPLSQSWNRHNSTKTFSIVDDLTIQSISIHETDTSMNKTSQSHHHHHHSAYSSTSPSLSSSSSASPEPMKSSQKLEYSKRKSEEPMYFDPLSTSTIADQHVYHQILNPPNSSTSSFTNSAFTQSPHRTATKEFDPFAK